MPDKSVSGPEPGCWVDDGGAARKRCEKRFLALEVEEVEEEEDLQLWDNLRCGGDEP